MTRWQQLLDALGLTGRIFESEIARFDLGPRTWLADRLHQLGWVPAAEMRARVEEARRCPEPCCQKGTTA